MASVVALGRAGVRPDFRYPTPLLDGTLIRRYKRFLADVRFADGREETVHCANPGRMLTCSEPGSAVRVSDSGNPRRKLRCSLEQIRSGRIWVCVNTLRPNATVAEALHRDGIPTLAGYPGIRREVDDGAGSRFDFLLERPGERCWVEVKSCTLRVGAEGRFPDAVTARGLKHIEGLASRVAQGERAVLLYFVGRADVQRFRPAWEIDPAYAQRLQHAAAEGVEVLALRARMDARGIAVDRALPHRLTRARIA